MSYLNGTPRVLPDQPVPTVDPEIERLAHMLVDGLIEKLSAEPAAPAASLLDNLAGQIQQAAALHRLGVVRRTTDGAPGQAATPRRAPSKPPAAQPGPGRRPVTPTS
jgi:hypothetical protein